MMFITYVGAFIDRPGVTFIDDIAPQCGNFDSLPEPVSQIHFTKSESKLAICQDFIPVSMLRVYKGEVFLCGNSFTSTPRRSI